MVGEGLLTSLATKIFGYVFNRITRPWTALPTSAFVRAHHGDWYRVDLHFVNKEHSQVDILSIKVKKPRGVIVSEAVQGIDPQFVRANPAAKSVQVNWGIPPATDRPGEITRTVFVNLAEHIGETVGLDFEIGAQRRDNARNEFPVRVKGNSVRA